MPEISTGRYHPPNLWCAVETYLANRLKPCPFCGSDAYLNTANDGAFVECVSCGAMTIECTDAQSAIALWNTRPTQS